MVLLLLFETVLLSPTLLAVAPTSQRHGRIKIRFTHCFSSYCICSCAITPEALYSSLSSLSFSLFEPMLVLLSITDPIHSTPRESAQESGVEENVQRSYRNVNQMFLYHYHICDRQLYHEDHYHSWTKLFLLFPSARFTLTRVLSLKSSQESHIAQEDSSSSS